jgi:hypothetical protein
MCIPNWSTVLALIFITMVLVLSLEEARVAKYLEPLYRGLGCLGAGHEISVSELLGSRLAGSVTSFSVCLPHFLLRAKSQLSYCEEYQTLMVLIQC